MRHFSGMIDYIAEVHTPSEGAEEEAAKVG